jgi:hypothetical protein
MGDLTNIAEFFLISLALGVGFFSFLANTKETGAGFLRVAVGLCGGSALLSLILHLTYGSVTDPQSIGYVTSLICFVLIYQFHKDEKSVFMWLLYAIHNVSLFFTLAFLMNFNTVQFIFGLSSVILLGSVTYAMVMGHWYLVTPRLSEQPLKKALYFSWAILLVKVPWSFLEVTEAGAMFEVGTRLGGGYAFNWMLVLMRSSFGYLTLAGMSYFAYRLVAMRSIQSATGMLYAMTFLVFVGELISSFMFFQYGVMI